MKKNKLLLIAPSVLGPLGKNSQLEQVVINTPTLNKVLQRSICQSLQGSIECIEQIVLKQNNSQETVANYLARQANIYKKNYDYLLVDFTSMTIAKDHIRLGIKIQDDLESTATLIDELNHWYVDKPWSFVIASTGQVFLQSSQGFDVKSYPTNFVSGKNISHFMPVCKQQKDNWLHIINELQMILFQSSHVKNSNIKSVWIWGEQKAADINSIDSENVDTLLFSQAEQALLEQDSEKWLQSLTELDALLQERQSNYKTIDLLLDYQHIYHYKKPSLFSISQLPFIKTPTLHKWIQLDG